MKRHKNTSLCKSVFPCLFLYFILSPLCSLIHAQEYGFRRLGVEDGLSQITVSDIFQDEKSRIWIATLDGLNCFDGNRIRVFNNFHNDSISYGNLHVTQMVGDAQGHLYLLSSTGLFRFELETETYSLLPLTSPVALANGKQGVWIAEGNKLYRYAVRSSELVHQFTDLLLPDIGGSMVEDEAGSLWCALKERGLMRIGADGGQTLLLKDVKVMKLLAGEDGSIWVGSQEHGVFGLSSRGEVIHHYLPGKQTAYTLRDDMARALCRDMEGNIWVGYRSGLSKIAVQTGKIDHYEAYPNRINAMSNQSVTSLYTDKQGTVWVGTYWGGVNYFSPEYRHFVHYSSTDSGLSFPVIGAMTEDNTGNVWICTEGGGLNLYEPRTERFTPFNSHSGTYLSSDYLKDVVFDEQNSCLWIAADFSNKINRFRLTDRKNEVRTIEGVSRDEIGEALFALADTPECLYIGSTSGVVALNKGTMKAEMLFRQKELFTHNYNALLLDSHNRLWFATDEGCIAYSIGENRFDTCKIVLEQQIGSQKELVNVFYETKEGDIYVGTHGCGLFVLDKDKKAFHLHTDKTKLSGENIRVLGELPAGDLLIGTGHGLSLLRKQNGQVVNFNSKTGFPLTLVNRKSMFVSCSGNIYMGGTTGVVLFQESRLQYPPRKYDLQLSHLYVNNKEIKVGDNTGILKKGLSYTDGIKLTHAQNVFSIGFYTDNFLHVGGDEVMYRLVGYNDEWVANRSASDITYTNIASGNYVFEIMLKNNPSQFKALQITIVPPFYATWWAYATYVCALLTILYFVIREYRIRLFLKTSLNFELREKKHIEEMNQSKLRFFTNISHEIRTPITLILGQVDVLLNSGKLSAYAYSKLLNIHKNADSLKLLISELLDFRKQEQGLLNLHISLFELQTLLEEHYVMFKELAVNRNIAFSLNVSLEQSPVWGDRRQIRKVINNLLSNAFKYTPDGGRISVELMETPEEYVVVVSDNGIGISDKDRERIFERFYQVENNGQNVGTGIGLALSLGIMEAHGGTIEVESKQSRGAVFKVVMRKGDAHFAPTVCRINAEDDKEYIYHSEEKDMLIKEIQAAQKESGTTDCKLLVVDDNEEIRETLVEIFSPLYSVEMASDGTEAYEKVKSMQPDLVISDIMMPGMPGTELCAKIKRNIETSHIPVVLLTALSAPERELEGLRIGADIYVVKPFDMRRLVMQCNNLINVRRMLQQKYAKQLDAPMDKIATNSLDKSFIERAIRIVENNIENPDFNVDAFSKEMNVGRTVLFQKIKGITGTTPNNFIMNLRLKKAAYLLLNAPEMNISDIAYRLSFGNPQYFNKCFRELFGIPPTQFRKVRTTAPIQDTSEC